MKYMISVYLWLVGFIYFVFFLIFALTVSFFISPEKYNPWLKKVLRLFFKVMWIPVEVVGAEKIDPNRTYLYMANHVSLFDIPLLGGYLPGFVRGVEAIRQHRWPLYGLAMGRLGNIPIEQSDIHGSIATIRQTIRVMRQGRSMIILPEGHRTLDGKLRPFKKLPFFLAKQVESEVIPVGLSGLFTLKNKGSWLIKPIKLKVKFGSIISADTVKSLTIYDLSELVREQINDLVEYP